MNYRKIMENVYSPKKKTDWTAVAIVILSVSALAYFIVHAHYWLMTY